MKYLDGYKENTRVDDTPKCGFKTLDEGRVILVNIRGTEVHNPGRFPPLFLNGHQFAISHITLSLVPHPLKKFLTKRKCMRGI